MKKIILAVLVGILLTAATLPQFFYYSDMRKAIAIRDDQQGTVVIRNHSGDKVMVADYPSNSSRWISVYRLAPGPYAATTANGVTISFYRRP